MCHDGCTVVIGGLMREDVQKTSNQVPLLGSIPYLGILFRNQDQHIERREILIVLTPRIVYDPEFNHDSAASAEDYQRRHLVVDDYLSPVTRPYLGRRYVRKAEVEVENGNPEKAARLAQLALRFDPQNREAIQLRSDLEEQVPPSAVRDKLAPPAPPSGKTNVGKPPAVPPESGDAVAPWMLDDLEGRPAAPQPLPMHPRDPGVPGRIHTVEKPGVMNRAP
jgi:hypothetical protein